MVNENMTNKEIKNVLIYGLVVVMTFTVVVTCFDLVIDWLIRF